MKAIEPVVIGLVPMHHAPIDRGAIGQGQMHRGQMGHVTIDHGAMHHAPIGQRAIENDPLGPKADPSETAMKRDGNLEKANVPIQTLVNAKPLEIAKNRRF